MFPLKTPTGNCLSATSRKWSKILSSWKKNNVHHKADIEKVDSSYRKTKKPAEKNTYSNMFTQFEQHDYDFEALEKKLLSKK